MNKDLFYTTKLHVYLYYVLRTSRNTQTHTYTSYSHFAKIYGLNNRREPLLPVVSYSQQEKWRKWAKKVQFTSLNRESDDTQNTLDEKGQREGSHLKLFDIPLYGMKNQE